MRRIVRAARIADELVGALDHAVLFAGLLAADFAAACQFEALFRTALGLELGPFACLLKNLKGA